MFEVGQKVIYDGNKISTVTKVTPTGRVRIDYCPDYQFDKNGIMMGTDAWHHHWIEEATEEEIEEVRLSNYYAKIRRKLKEFDFNQLSREQLNKVIAIINEVK